MNKIKSFVSYAFFSFSFCGIFLETSSFGLTPIQLKKVSISDSQRVDLFFDRKVDLSLAKVEIHNELLQITLNGTTVYPAKITTSSGPYITKVFSYQYAPQVVRTRISFKEKIEDLDKKFESIAQGNTLSIRFKFKLQSEIPSKISEKLKESSLKSDITLQNSKPSLKQEPQLSNQANGQPNSQKEGQKNSQKNESINEKLLKKIESPELSLSSSPSSLSDNKLSEKTNESNQATAMTVKDSDASSSKQSSKNWKSKWFRLYGVLALMLLIGSFILVGAKQIKAGKGKRIAEFLDKVPLLNKGSSILGMIGKKAPVIEVLANQYIGPKKQVTVIKVAGRTLVLGVSADNINLISEFSEFEVDEEATTDINSSIGNASIHSKNTNQKFQNNRAYIEPSNSGSFHTSANISGQRYGRSTIDKIRNKVKEMGPMG